MALSFFDTFFDNEYRQRRDINELTQMETAMADDVATLGANHRKLQLQVRELSTTVAVLVKMLEEAGHVDAKVMRYRVEAMIEEMSAPRENVIRCVACGREVQANRTLMTAQGATCDPGCAP